MWYGNQCHKIFVQADLVFRFSNYNEKRKANFKFEFQCSVIWKSENQLVLCFMSQFQYKNINQSFLFLILCFNLSTKTKFWVHGFSKYRVLWNEQQLVKMKYSHWQYWEIPFEIPQEGFIGQGLCECFSECLWILQKYFWVVYLSR